MRIGANVTAVGQYHVVAVERRIATPADKPLLLGLPVPDGANPDDMAMAMLLPTNQNSETTSSGSRWTSLLGRYDADSKLFVVTVGAMPLDILHLVLVEHPSFDQLPLPTGNANAMASGAQAAAGTSVIASKFTNADRCRRRSWLATPVCDAYTATGPRVIADSGPLTAKVLARTAVMPNEARRAVCISRYASADSGSANR